MFKVEEVILENRGKRKLSYSGSWALVDCIVDDDSATLLQTPRLSEGNNLESTFN